MFWSPAVATFRTLSWAAAGTAMSAPARAPASQSLFTVFSLVLRILEQVEPSRETHYGPSSLTVSSLVLVACKQVQGPQGQAQAHRAIDRQRAVVRHGVVAIRDRDPVPVLATGVGALGDAARQHERALDAFVGSDDLRDVVAKIR